MNNATLTGYDVYKNDTYVGFVRGCNASVRQHTVRALVSSTHMGGFRRCGAHVEYATTIGVYIRFEKCKRLAATIQQYLLQGETI